MHFAAPEYFWLLLLVPVVSALLGRDLVLRRRALARFVAQPLAPRLVVAASLRRQMLKLTLQVVGLLLVVLALARPQSRAASSHTVQRGIDLVIALDVSLSMLAEDVKPNRLQRAVFQIRDLLERLAGHRVGLVLFAGKAFIQCPLTLDYDAIDLFLDLAAGTPIPVPGTDLEDALRVAGSCFEGKAPGPKAIILFTDGEDHGEATMAAAAAAATAGVRIFVVGVGSPAGGLIPIRTGDGQRGFHRDQAGSPVHTRLNQVLLQDMALCTDGDYYRSTLEGGELAALARELAAMSRKELGERWSEAVEERFQWPLGLGVLCLLGQLLVGDGLASQRAWRGRFG